MITAAGAASGQGGVSGSEAASRRAVFQEVGGRSGESRVLGSDEAGRPALCMAVVIFIAWRCQASLSFLRRQHKSRRVHRLLWWCLTSVLLPPPTSPPPPCACFSGLWKWSWTCWLPLTGLAVPRVVWIPVQGGGGQEERGL